MSNAHDERFDHIRRTHPALLTRDEAMQLLRVGTYVFDRLRRQGHIHAVGLPTVTRTFFLLEDVIGLMQSETFPTSSWLDSHLNNTSIVLEDTEDDKSQPEL